MDAEPFALFDDTTWPDRPAQLLTNSQGVIEARDEQDVPAALAAVDDAARQGLTAAGYCAYELGYCFEPRLKHLLPRNGEHLLRFHLFAERRWLSAPEKFRWLLDRGNCPATIGPLRASVDESAHQAKLENIRQLIGAGDVYQVNLTFKFRGEFAGDPIALYLSLAERARTGGAVFVRFLDEDILCFSPEKFFEIRHGRISARPMKGTAGRAGRLSDDEQQRHALQIDPKQRAENLMIVDLLRNDLARVSRTGSVVVTDLFSIETYPRFHTLTSGIEADLACETSLAKVLPALFPCGSVTGAPKIRAMEIIHEVENEPRGVYCGAIGFVAAQEMAFAVGIRTIVLRAQTLELGVGGGIVWDSKAQSEYQECLIKARFLTDPDQSFRLIETMRFDPDCGIYLLERHLQRLEASARYCGFRFDAAKIQAALKREAQYCLTPSRIRLSLGVRGDTQIEFEWFDQSASASLWRFTISERCVNSDDWRLYHKTSLRQFYDEELERARQRVQCDEAVFVNERGEITEGSRTSLFLQRGEQWLTPPLSCGLLDGVLRRELLEHGPQKVEECVLYPNDLLTGTVWLGNSLRGLIRAEQVWPNKFQELLDLKD